MASNNERGFQGYPFSPKCYQQKCPIINGNNNFHQVKTFHVQVRTVNFIEVKDT